MGSITYSVSPHKHTKPVNHTASNCANKAQARRSHV